jgi:hypothetical protein
VLERIGELPPGVRAQSLGSVELPGKKAGMSLFALSRIAVGAASPDGTQRVDPAGSRVGGAARDNAVANAEATVSDPDSLIVAPRSLRHWHTQSAVDRLAIARCPVIMWARLSSAMKRYKLPLLASPAILPSPAEVSRGS